ncbi:MAG: DUF3179 domain-containing protein [Anaerolineales bacterium]|nr:DUF3179 domain-containing protein [Anaerolineales bacterium]
MTKSSFLLIVSLLLLVELAACGQAAPPAAAPSPTAVPDDTAAADAPAATPTAVPSATTAPEDTPAPPATAVSTAPIDDAEAARLLMAFLDDSDADAQAALDRVLAAGDQRFTAVLIEMFRARAIGIVRTLEFETYAAALETLTGQPLGTGLGSWIEWYAGTDLVPPPGFTSWKGRLYVRLDVFFGEFLQDRHPSRIRVEEIMWGGVVVDGIPALDNPAMLPAAEAEYLDPENAVFGLVVNGEARAYPLRILDWHEMANDVIGGVPVSLAYCTLCGAAIAYDGRASDGETYTFGSSGFLYRSNKLMYDRQTRTLWNQLTGEPVLGELAASDVTLSLLPVVLTTWAEWQARHPETLVVDIETGYGRAYTPGAAYGNYFADERTMFPVAPRSDVLDTKAQIFALRLGGTPKAYPLEALVAAGVVNDVVAETAVVLIAPGALIDVSGVNQYVGPVTYAAGAEVRAYAGDGRLFKPGAKPDTVLDEAGGVWQVTEEALIGPDGEMAPRLPGHLAYWFGWYAFFPQTEVWSGSRDS